MHHPVGGFPHIQQCIQCPCCCPHDIAAGFIVFRVFDSNTAAVNQRTHQTFGDIIGGVVVIAGEILFCDMVHDIVNARYHLPFGQCVSQFRVQDGKLGEYIISKDMPNFQFLFMVITEPPFISEPVPTIVSTHPTGMMRLSTSSIRR